MMGTFGVATPEKALFARDKSQNTSITSDGTYLYVCGQRNGETMMYKVGTGENNTIPGKVYLGASMHGGRSNFNQWVYCDEMLYARRSDEQVGVIYLVDPHTFKLKETVRMDFN